MYLNKKQLFINRYKGKMFRIQTPEGAKNKMKNKRSQRQALRGAWEQEHIIKSHL